MALNFKIFETKQDADLFLADQIRKQLTLNSDSILVFDLADKLDDAYNKFLGDVQNHPLSFANIRLFLANSSGGAKFNKLDIPKQQLKNVQKDEDLENALDKKERVNVAILNLENDRNVGFSQGDSQETLLHAKELFVFASGIDASDAVRHLYNADMRKSGTLSDVKNHRMVTVILDQEAASKLDYDVRNFYTYKFA